MDTLRCLRTRVGESGSRGPSIETLRFGTKTSRTKSTVLRICVWVFFFKKEALLVSGDPEGLARGGAQPIPRLRRGGGCPNQQCNLHLFQFAKCLPHATASTGHEGAAGTPLRVSVDGSKTPFACTGEIRQQKIFLPKFSPSVPCFFSRFL